MDCRGKYFYCSASFEVDGTWLTVGLFETEYIYGHLDKTQDFIDYAEKLVHRRIIDRYWALYHARQYVKDWNHTRILDHMIRGRINKIPGIFTDSRWTRKNPRFWAHDENWREPDGWVTLRSVVKIIREVELSKAGKQASKYRLKRRTDEWHNQRNQKHKIAELNRIRLKLREVKEFLKTYRENNRKVFREAQKVSKQPMNLSTT